MTKKTTAKKPAEETPATEATTQGKVQVTALADQGRWRAGKFFTREATSLNLADLADGELEELKADPMLKVVEVN